jgi:hypothetical protein
MSRQEVLMGSTWCARECHGGGQVPEEYPQAQEGGTLQPRRLEHTALAGGRVPVSFRNTTLGEGGTRRVRPVVATPRSPPAARCIHARR